MSDIKLFNIKGAIPIELASKSVALEKSLQNLIEKHLEIFLGVRFLATEYSTGKVHNGRIDTLGIDENGCPVIIEYKRSTNENVVNQGLFYLDWPMDHRGDFELLALKVLGKETSDNIEWNRPRLLCIAGDFNKYDAHAVQQNSRNIGLIRYRLYEKELLALELINSVQANDDASTKSIKVSKSGVEKERITVDEQLAGASVSFRDLYEAFRSFCLGLGDDVEETHLKFYVAFKRIKNFAAVVPFPRDEKLTIFVKLDPTTMEMESGFTRDMRKIGHLASGDVEIMVRSMEDLERAKELLVRSYEGS